MKLLINLIFATYFSLLLTGGERFKWTEISFPSEDNSFRIIDVAENNDIWLHDLQFNIYRSSANGWIKYNTSYNDSLTPVKIIKIDENKFFAWAFDTKYFSHIKIFENGKWTNLNYIVDVPLNSVVKVDENDYYIHGNFGRLIRLKDNRFIPIKNPFKNHIWSAIKSHDGTIWFGTKYDGIYKYKNEIFTKVDFADNSNYEIISLIEVNKIIYAYHNEYNIFELRDNKFQKVNKSLAEISGSLYDSKIGITSYSVLKDSLQVKVNYPSKFQPSQVFIKNDSLVFMISDNKLFRGNRYNNFYFYELAGSYLVDGAEQSSSTQSFFNDFNNDGYTDLIVGNVYPPELNNLYVGNNQFPFQERLFKLDDELKDLAIRIYDFADLNNDYYDDVIVSIIDSIGSGISVYWNNKDFTFTKHKTLYSPEYLLKSPVRNIESVDIDNDGDLDINLSYYYGKEDQPGNDIFFTNSFNGQFFELDTSYNELSKGWNAKSTFADVDNDGDLDWFQSVIWWKDRLHLNEYGKFINVSKTHLDDKVFQNTHGSGFADIDNDGDLDLIRSSDEQLVSISLNNGKGIFKDATDSLINRFNDFTQFSYSGYKSINIFDVNNDGYLDILLVTKFTSSNNTTLLLNEKGKAFKSYNDFGISKDSQFYNSAVADIDYDGDLDIYLIKNGKNLLLVNNLDDENHIRIKLVGVASNTSAKNSKIWLFRNNTDSLVGYRETGINNFSTTHKNEDIIHFGADKNFLYDIKIQFQSGNIVTVNNIKPPYKLTINEDDGIYKDALVFGNTLFNLTMESEIQFYAVIIFITIIMIGLSIKYGHEKFNWDIRLSIGLVIVNFSFFWIILLLSYDSQSLFLKFALPSIIASFGVIIPNLVFLSLKSNIIKRNISDYKDELLNQVINFSHGEWALKNINSLIFLQQSIPPDINENEKYKKQLKERINTFNSLTIKSIEKIISISQQIDFEKESTKHLKQTVEEIKILNKKIISNDFYFTEKERKLFVILKEIMRMIRNNTISEYSCNPIEVIDQVLEANKTMIKKNHVNVEFIYPAELKKYALIKANELADIIDNSVVNAVKSFKEKINCSIIIEVKWVAPKFRITIMNNGEEISIENREKIFEKGFSTLGGSGFGLYNSRNILIKYGGRLILQSSISQWTNFLIELNEGYINETSYSDN